MRRPRLSSRVLAVVAAVSTLAVWPGATSSQAQTPPAVMTARSPTALTLQTPKAGRTRPLVVVLGHNGGAETTDFVIPYGILKDADVADVLSVSTDPGPVHLMMSMTILADATITQFDRRHPEGADLIIVPYIPDRKNAVVTAWLKDQYAKGATVMSICGGAANVAETGLFDGRKATTHWSGFGGLKRRHPTVQWTKDRRYLQDGRLISTAGVSASIPASLALVEGIAGRQAAEAQAARLGVKSWGGKHRTSDFLPTASDVAQGLANVLIFWRHETVEVPAREGYDEIALALQSDAWGRTYKTKVVITGPANTTLRSRRGLLLLPDAEPKEGAFVVPAHMGGGGAQLDQTLLDMDQRYGRRTTRLATKTLEYPRP
ncbi:DJ-1/PfpI family protein [Caulobacter sp. ErkDOM-YI]|uniref:DJ-1/PfpI family protein n=1 Tax=unclassified Caulobacter TaxID=2648921 RepID=UPI003AF5FB62